MAPLLGPQDTSFSLDTMGRFLCNTLQEALDSTARPVAGSNRGFDVIVVGGGTFGSVLAESLFVRDKSRCRRILVLEAGPFVLPEHVQNLPFQGGDPDMRRPWVYGPVTPDYQFPGLLFALGGRSLKWGGWSPELLHNAVDDEMAAWPVAVVKELNTQYFPAASDAIGVTSTNDFIHGPLHTALRRRLLGGLQGPAAPPGLILADLPDHPIVRSHLLHLPTPTNDQLRARLGLPSSDTTPRPALLTQLVSAVLPDALVREWLNLPPTDTTPRAALLTMLQAAAPGSGRLKDWLQVPSPDPISRAAAVELLQLVIPTDAQLRDWLNLPPTDRTARAALLGLLKLEAPLAVQSVTEPGAFPINKFSAVPLLAQAARTASKEADGVGPDADARKRVVVVPKCHVQELITETQPDNWVRVVGVRALDATGASLGIPLAPARLGGQSVVVVALGTIESTRVALTTFQDSLGWRAAKRMGENLLAHLRSNLTIRIPIAALQDVLPPDAVRTLQVSALFVKGKATVGSRDRYFHLQITASGLQDLGNDSEARLFKKVPDVDQVKAMTEADSSTVVITLRGIGEMSPMNPDSRVGLAMSPGDVDFGRPAAYAVLGNALDRNPAAGSQQTKDDRAVWDAMDEFADRVALIFAAWRPFEILTNRLGVTFSVPAGATAADLKALRESDQGRLKYDLRDPLGTTHHEAGTMRMSDQPADGVTNDYGRVHDTTNCYVASPALFPTTGSPNPMLTGVALARRTADLLTASVLPKPQPFAPAAPWRAIFDGTAVSFNRWSRVSPDATNGFALIDGEIVTYGTRDFGLLYYAAEAFADFTLRLQFRVVHARGEVYGDATKVQNSGVFVRFRDPLRDPTAAVLDRMRAEGNDIQLFQGNRAWGAVHSGFEVQIDDNALGDTRKDFYGVRPEKDGLRKNRTGAIYKIPAKDPIPNTSQFDAEWQVYNPAKDLQPGTWYEFEIDARGETYTVDLTNTDTGEKVRTTTFTNTDPVRGVARENGQPAGYIGLQSYSNSPVAFRRIAVRT